MAALSPPRSPRQAAEAAAKLRRAGTNAALGVVALLALMLLWTLAGPGAQGGRPLEIVVSGLASTAGQIKAAVAGGDPGPDAAAAEADEIVAATLRAEQQQAAAQQGGKGGAAESQLQAAQQQIAELKGQLEAERAGKQRAEQAAAQAQAQEAQARAQQQQQQQQQHQAQQQAASAAAAAAAAAAAGQPAEAQAPDARTPEQRRKDFTAAVSKCWWMDCFSKQQHLEPGPGQFRYPHFYIIGFQKCATTSLYHHLADHPQTSAPVEKEPEYFTLTCGYNMFRCNKTSQVQYFNEIMYYKRVAAAGFGLAAFEGSTHYALEGRWLAPQLRAFFPWVKLLLSMREPISQAISMAFHNLDVGRNVPCFHQRGDGTVARCAAEYLDQHAYADSLRPWLEQFPRDQLLFFQYENLTSAEHMPGALRDIKTFLGLDPALPSQELGLFNARHQTKQTDGWPMKRSQYEELIGKARRNSLEVVDIVRQQRFADADAWMQNWEAAWQDTLDNHCGAEPDSQCMVQLT